MPRIGRRITPGLDRAAWGFMQSGDFPVPVLHLKFGENTGTEAKDSSPEGNDGEISGASWVKGWLGPGLSFDGLDDYVEISHDASLAPEEFTIILRVKYPSDTAPDNWEGILDKGRSSDVGYYILQLKDTWQILAGYSFETGRVAISGADFSDNLFHEAAFTHESRVIILYVDGVEIDRDTGSEDIVHGELDIRIGMRTEGNYVANIVVDEVFIFDEVLSAAQIRQHSDGYR